MAFRAASLQRSPEHLVAARHKFGERIQSIAAKNVIHNILTGIWPPFAASNCAWMPKYQNIYSAKKAQPSSLIQTEDSRLIDSKVMNEKLPRIIQCDAFSQSHQFLCIFRDRSWDDFALWTSVHQIRHTTSEWVSTEWRRIQCGEHHGKYSLFLLWFMGSIGSSDLSITHITPGASQSKPHQFQPHLIPAPHELLKFLSISDKSDCHWFVFIFAAGYLRNSNEPCATHIRNAIGITATGSRVQLCRKYGTTRCD